jgi:uncharacterized protein (DUF1697 family)
VRFEYFVSYNAVAKRWGSVFGHTTFYMDGGKVESDADVQMVQKHIEEILRDEYDEKFTVVILDYKLLREVIGVNVKLTEAERAEKIEFIRMVASEFGISNSVETLKAMSDEQLDKEADWYWGLTWK